MGNEEIPTDKQRKKDAAIENNPGNSVESISTKPPKEFELTPEKEQEIIRLAHIFIDKIKGNAEGFDGMDGADASDYLMDGYEKKE